jgi:hypothetical protein
MGHFSELDAMMQESTPFNNFINQEPEAEDTFKGFKFAYDWQYRKLGGFDQQLANLISKGDRQNQAKLFKAFPEETQAIVSYQSKEGWWDKCQDAVEGVNKEV